MIPDTEIDIRDSSVVFGFYDPTLFSLRFEQFSISF